MRHLIVALAVVGGSVLVPATSTSASSGPAAHYDPSFSGGWWCNTYALHRSWGNAVGGEYCNPNWYFGVHPDYAPGSWLTVTANGRTIDVFIADMVQLAHQAQWRSKWAVELSWPAFVALGLVENNYVTLGWQSPVEVAIAQPPATRTFDETGYTIGGAFKTFWESNGGLPIFGYPLSHEYTENGMTVQVFERAIFEWHPDNDEPYRVLLRRLGADSLASSGAAELLYARGGKR